jgi:8-oxo-dGTP diphosphatase
MNQHSVEEHIEYMEALPKRVSSVGLMLETHDGRLLIVKASYKKHWTVPGGVIDERETPLQAAVRETYEEVGLTINPEDVTFVAVANRTGPVFDTYQFIFKAPLPNDMEIRLQEDEIDEYMLVTREQVATKDRYYGEVIYHWANGRTGYIEQAFEKQQE